MDRRLWIDAHNYGARLLRGGEEPWRTPESIGMFCADLTGLLHPDRLLLPIAPLIARYVTSTDDSADARAAAFDEALGARTIMTDLDVALASLAQTHVAPRVVPILPGASLIAGGAGNDDALDDILSSLGDLLRALAPSAPVAVVLDEPNEVALDMASSLFRIAAHLGISLVPVGTRRYAAAALCFPASDDAGALGKGESQNLGDLMNVEPQAIMAGARDCCLTILADAPPEQVLAHLAALRSGGGGA